VNLWGIARFTFHEGKVDDFTCLSEQCMEIVRTKDNGTLQYDIYFNDDESEPSSSRGTEILRHRSSILRTSGTT